MTYWVVRIDTELPKLPGGVWSEVRIQYPSPPREAAEKIAKRLNEGEVERDAQASRSGYRTPPGTTRVVHFVVSDEEVQDYYRVGTRVLK